MKYKDYVSCRGPSFLETQNFLLLLSLGLDIQYLIVTTILSILCTQMTTSKLSNNPEPENSTQMYFSLSFPFLSSLQPPTLFFKHPYVLKGI